MPIKCTHYTNVITAIKKTAMITKHCQLLVTS